MRQDAAIVPTARRRGESMDIQIGLDTISFYYSLSPKQKREITKKLKASSEFKTVKSDYENDSYEYTSDYFAEQGVKLHISRYKGKPWGLLVIVHPTLVLGDSDRSALSQATKASYNKMVRLVDKILKSVNVPCSLDDMLLYRMDVTVNLVFDDRRLADEYIRILKKSMILHCYRLDWFREKEKKAKDCKLANRHSYKQYCKSAAFFAYDKTAQLEMIDRFPDTLIGKRVLRLEIQLRRRALKKWVDDRELGSNWETIRNICKNQKRIIKWYLDRIQPKGEYVRYKDAVDLIKNAKLKKKTRDRMLFLLRKTSDKDSLTAALKDLKSEYHLTGSQCRTVLKKLRKLGISPITLANHSDFGCLPYISL